MASAREVEGQGESAPLLRVSGLRVAFDGDEGRTVAVDGVSFELGRGRALALVGESGCGKSVTSLAILRLLPDSATILSGAIELEGQDLVRLTEPALRGIRGRRIAMIFQDPSSALNPVMRIGAQIAEGLTAHLGVGRQAALERAVELLRRVGIPAPEERVNAFPHELSGGMRQRVMIAMALSAEPQLLLADEPTTALDVTIQAQILELLGTLRRETGLSVLLVTHDLGVVADFADDVVVMYAGTVVERASAAEILRDPRHPYAQGLLRSVPGFGDNARRVRLPTIAGMVPSLRELPGGCRFRTRCDRAEPRCADAEPPLTSIGAGRDVACFVAVDQARSEGRAGDAVDAAPAEEARG